jgi:single-strand DNA-binding protein
MKEGNLFMLNSVNLTGRLTQDPELRYTASGTAVANASIAVQRTFTNADGEREADFFRVVIFNKQAENVANYLTKGSLIAVEGRLQSGSYEKDGQKHYTTDVVANAVHFLESKKEDQGKSSQNNRNNQRQSTNRGGRR